MKAWSAIACVVLVACSQTLNPCPEGSEVAFDLDRCVMIAPVEKPDAGDGPAPRDGGDTEMDAGEMDAGATDAGATDAGVTDGGGDGTTDATPDSAAPEPDAEVEPPVCSEQDVTAWRAFHEREGIVADLTACFALGCTALECPAAACVRERAGVAACEACTQAEAECTVSYCGTACGTKGRDEWCRACVCEAGCVQRFDTCARESLDVCAGVYGRDGEASERGLDGPLMIRAKTATGLIDLGALAPAPSEGMSFSQRQSWSVGSWRFIAFPVADAHYVLQHKSRCGDEPCIARISPFLRDATFGRPAYLDNWSRGWDTIEPFRVDGQTYLLRYKSGAEPVDREPKGYARIDRLELDASASTLRLVGVYESQWHAPIQEAWSSVRMFALGGRVHLLRYGTGRDGALELLGVSVVQGGAITLSSVADALSWSSGWDRFETLVSAGRTYLIAYKSGLIPLSDEPAGTVRVIPLSRANDDNVSLLPTVFEASWPTGLTHLIGYRNGTHDYLFRYSTADLQASLIRLDAPALWTTDSLGSVVYSSRWTASPVFDAVEVVHDGKW